ncbi:Methyltransferase-like protein 21A, variant 2 [Trebouxia sp. C0010 RCD-2024]
MSEEQTSEDDDGHSMWSRPFTFAGKTVRVEEAWGLGIDRFQGSRCIELGAGATGLPGIVAAQLGCFSQVVITDVDECLEALHENVSVNLPSHCTLVPSGLSQEHKAAAIATRPASLSQPSATSSSQSHTVTSGTSDNYSQPAYHTAAVHNSSTVASPQNLSRSNDAVQQQSTEKQSARVYTEVLVAELDWARDASSVAPPFDVVLVADVVYVPQAMQPLLECIRRVSTAASTILLAKYKRFAPASEQFWKLLPDYFEFTKIPEADFGAKPQEDCIGIFKLVWKP